jgi:hypothetical protein
MFQSGLRPFHVLKSFMLCDITQWPVEVSWRFRGTYRRHLQVLRVSEGRNQDEAGSEHFVGRL